MNTNTNARVIPDALHLAADAANLLADMGTRVIGVYANGRRPVLLIDVPPQFVRGVIKHRCRAEGDQQVLVHASGFHGCQIEWSTTVALPREVANG